MGKGIGIVDTRLLPKTEVAKAKLQSIGSILSITEIVG
jgi:hypothetical protein